MSNDNVDFECLLPPLLPALDTSDRLFSLPPMTESSFLFDIDKQDEDDSAVAVVSLYQSWASSTSTLDSKDLDEVEEDVLSSALPKIDESLYTTWTVEELEEELRKRLKPEDMPPTIIPRKRSSSRPRCLFINHLSSSRFNQPQTTAASTTTETMKRKRDQTTTSSSSSDPDCFLNQFLSSKAHHPVEDSDNDEIINVIDANTFDYMSNEFLDLFDFSLLGPIDDTTNVTNFCTNKRQCI